MSVDRKDRAGIEVEDHRPALVRMYGVVAWAAFALLAVVVGLVYRRVAVGRLIYAFEGQAFAVAQRFTTAVWPRVRTISPDVAQMDPGVLRASEEIAGIRAALTALAADLPLVEAQVTSADGTILFATQPERIGAVATDPVVLEMIAGRYFGRGRTDAVTERAGARITTYVAVRHDLRDVEAVVEITQDAAPQLRRIGTVQAIGTGSAIGVATLSVILIFGVLPPAGPREERDP